VGGCSIWGRGGAERHRENEREIERAPERERGMGREGWGMGVGEGVGAQANLADLEEDGREHDLVGLVHDHAEAE
jgi:hypothetical protein